LSLKFCFAEMNVKVTDFWNVKPWICGTFSYTVSKPHFSVEVNIYCHGREPEVVGQHPENAVRDLGRVGRSSFPAADVLVEVPNKSVTAWPLLWSSGQSPWLQIQRCGFDSRRYQIFWEVVGLELGSLSLVSTIEELLGRRSSGSGLGNRDYGLGDPLHLLHPSIHKNWH
jgi:hypothetical protein